MTSVGAPGVAAPAVSTSRPPSRAAGAAPAKHEASATTRRSRSRRTSTLPLAALHLLGAVALLGERDVLLELVDVREGHEEVGDQEVGVFGAAGVGEGLHDDVEAFPQGEVAGVAAHRGSRAAAIWRRMLANVPGGMSRLCMATVTRPPRGPSHWRWEPA